MHFTLIQRYVLKRFFLVFIKSLLVIMGISVFMLLLQMQNSSPYLILSNFLDITRLLLLESFPYTLIYSVLLASIFTFAGIKNQEELELVDTLGQRKASFYYPAIICGLLLSLANLFFVSYLSPLSRKERRSFEFEALMKKPSTLALALSIKPNLLPGQWIYYGSYQAGHYTDVRTIRLTPAGDLILTKSPHLTIRLQKKSKPNSTSMLKSVHLFFKDFVMVMVGGTSQALQGPIFVKSRHVEIGEDLLQGVLLKDWRQKLNPGVLTGGEILGHLAHSEISGETIRALVKELLHMAIIGIAPLIFVVLGLALGLCSKNLNTTFLILAGTIIFGGYLAMDKVLTSMIRLEVSSPLICLLMGGAMLFSFDRLKRIYHE